MPLKKIILYFLALFLLSACATVAPLKPLPASEKRSIHSIKVSDKTPYPDEMFYHPPMLGTTLLIGFIGAAIVAEHQEPEILALVKNNNIQIDKIVQEAFVTSLEKQPRLKVVQSGPSDATLNLKILSYGLSNSDLSNVMTHLVLEMDLVRKGKIIWSGRDYVSTIHNKPDYFYPMHEIKKDPELIAKMWKSSAQQIADNATKDF